jgi:modification target Cys-rich repeat protein
MKKSLLISLAILCHHLLFAQATFTSNVYTQGFGTSPVSSWTNNSTFPGWYLYLNSGSFEGTINVTTAAPSNTGGIYMYTCNGGTDMKLGMRPSNADGDGPCADESCGNAVGVVLKNNTGSTIYNVQVSFEWFQLSLAQNGSVVNEDFFDYHTSSSNITSLTSGTWTNVRNGNFTALQSSSIASDYQIQGYPCTQDSTTTFCINVTIPANQYIAFRWWDPNNDYDDPHLAIDNVSVTAYNLNASASSSTICSGSNTTLTASGGASTYSWSPSTGLSATTGASVTASPTSTTTYTVTGTVPGGCTMTQTVVVNVNSLPTVSVSPSSAVFCIGGSTSLTASGANTYTWSPSTGLNVTTGATVTANPTSTTTYTVSGTNTSTGCVGTKTVVITVNPLPTISISPSAPSICIGSSTSLTASGATTYSWSPSTGLSATTGATVTANPTSTKTYTVTGTNSNGCVNTQTVIVTVNPLPTLTVTPSSATFCAGGSTSLTASGATTYTWSPSTGLNATTGATVSANPTSTKTYTVTGTNSNGCVNTQTVVVTVNTLPTISVSPSSATFCAGGSTSLTASGATTYTWSPTTGLSATTGATVTANPSSTKTYTVTGTNSNGCVNTQTVIITVNSLPTLTVTPSSATFCIGGSTSLTASGASTYTWSPSTGLSVTTGATVTANPTSTKTYTVTGTNANGCINTQTVIVTVNPLPTISVSPSSPSICIGSSTSLTASGATTYTWLPSTGLSATTGATVTANPSSTKTYTVTGTNSNGCVNTQTVVLTVNSLPVVSVTALHDTICAGSLDSLKASGASTYTWSPSTDLSASTGSKVAAIGMDTTITYTVTGTNANGCTSSASQTILVHSLPIVNADTDLAHYITGGSFSAIGGTPPYTYNWSPLPANPLLLPDTLTTYTLTVTDANGCSTSDITAFYPTPNVAGPCGSLFISDYVQDTVNNDDAIEIYNPTAGAINLSGYYLITDSLYAPPILIKLGGTIAAYGTYVIANSHADTSLTHKANMLTDTLSLNGSDLVALAHIVPLGTYVHFTLLDKIGDLINTPTDSGWAAGTGSTKNHTLVRKITIVMGNTNWSTCQNEWNVYPQGTFSYLKHFRNVCTPGDPHLIITMGTLATNCGGAPSTVDIPIYIQSDSDKIFNNCVIDLYYPTSEFYPDNVSNSGVTATQGVDFTYKPGDNDYNINMTNLSDSVVEIKFGDSASQSPYGTVVGSSQKLLMTVTLQIQNCNTNPIDFTNTASTYLSSYYATYDSTATSIKEIDSTKISYTTCCPHDCDPYLCNPHDCDPYLCNPHDCDPYNCNPYCCEYDSNGVCIQTCYNTCYHTCYDTCYNTCYDTCYHTCYDTTYQYHRDTIFNYSYTYNNIQYASTTYTGGGASSSVCLPLMSNYTNPIMAGTNQLSDPSNSSLMTIDGTDFGSTKGTIQVQNADAIGLITLDSTDILRWTSNQILVKMPSDLLLAKGKPGSGDFYVSNACGETVFDNLQINYNILSDDTGSEKLRPNIVMLNDTTSYIFRCDTSVSHNPKAYACVKKAIREWNCYTGVHWRVEADSTLAASKKDGISCIYFADPSIYSDSSVVMETTSQYFTTSCFDGTDSITFISEADISLNNSIPWNYDTTLTVTADSNYFYDDILHELGHAHQLAHINDTASLMYWNTVPGLRVGITSGGDYPGPASLTGGLDVVNTSAARSPSSFGCGSYRILVPDTKVCTDPTVGVATITANPYNLTIFPNPINDGTLNIAYRLTNDADVQLRIVDCIGREVLLITDTHQNVGIYGKRINIDALAEGMYFFVATINGKDQVIKFVKL